MGDKKKMISFCKCQGQIHKLKSNCIKCGLVLCEVYRDELCPFCNTILDIQISNDLLAGQLDNVILHRNKLIDNQSNKNISSVSTGD